MADNTTTDAAEARALKAMMAAARKAFNWTIPWGTEDQTWEAVVKAVLTDRDPGKAYNGGYCPDCDQLSGCSCAARLATAEAAEARALDMATAPKDGTMLRLLVDYTDGGAPLEDEHPRAWTIGFNSLENTGEDEWKFAGWCWTHDHFTQGSGTPVGWLPWSNPSTGGEAS